MEEWKAHVVSSSTEKKKKKRSSHRRTNLTILFLSITVRVPLTRKIKHLSYDTIVADHKECSLVSLLELQSVPKRNEEMTADQDNFLGPLTVPAMPKPFARLLKKQSRSDYVSDQELLQMRKWQAAKHRNCLRGGFAATCHDPSTGWCLCTRLGTLHI